MPKSTDDILWNIPEQKTGVLQLIGGHAGSFATVVKLAEFLNTLPLREVRITLPNSLQGKLPPLPGLSFAPATDSGSFAKSPEFTAAFADADFTLICGDLSKNSATAIAVVEALKSSTKPALITRDAVDLITPEAGDLIEHPGLTIFASMAQLQKLFRALYYPKMLLLSAPLQQVTETLHKFTLSYPCTILTLHGGQLIVAQGGRTSVLPLDKTSYSAISLWSGQLAGRIAALQLWNPNRPLDATLAALSWE